MWRQTRGHLWTIVPKLKHAAAPIRLPAGSRWQTVVSDPVMGAVRLSGIYHQRDGADTVAVIIHGFAGTPDSFYMKQASVAALAAGCSVLRLALRGADRGGEDFYHGGLTADIHAAIASDELARYRHVVVVGYSMGGHATVKLAAQPCDPRVRAAVAICAPLDLARVQRHMDRRAAFFYRRVLMRSLNSMYEAVANRGRGPISARDAWRISSFLEWDNEITCRRYGYDDAHAFYAGESAWPSLDALRIPTLLVYERMDPIVAAHVVRPHLEQPRPLLHVRWIDRGGHVGFPTDLDLGLHARPGLEAQLMGWLRGACRDHASDDEFPSPPGDVPIL